MSKYLLWSVDLSLVTFAVIGCSFSHTWEAFSNCAIKILSNNAEVSIRNVMFGPLRRKSKVFHFSQCCAHSPASRETASQFTWKQDDHSAAQGKSGPLSLFRPLHLLSFSIFSRPQRDPCGDNIFFIRPSAYHLFIPPSTCDTNPPFDVSNKFCK